MNSKRISLAQPLPVIPLYPGADNEIVVPREGAHYFLRDPNPACTLTFRLVTPETILQVTGLITTTAAPVTHITVIHEAPHTKAETLVRTLATGNAAPRFEGMIRIEPGAKHCESYLNHHSLVFDQAKSYTWPALEIQNNEVKCSHAATIRTITDHDLFYLRSRGLSVETARQVLIEAFFADIEVD